jgi:uncharacterized RDD family membrane protein YckC
MDSHQWLPYQEHDPAQRYADFGHRLLGMLIDGVLLVLASVAVSPVLIVPYAGFLIMFPVALIALMVIAWRRGASPGMRAAHIRLVDAKTGGLPRLPRLIPRAIFALLFFGAVIYGGPTLLGLGLYGLMVASLGPPNEEHRIALGDFVTVDYLVLASLLLIGILANLWMLWDRRRQTLVDKLSGVVVLRVSEPRAERNVRPATPTSALPVDGGQQPGPARDVAPWRAIQHAVLANITRIFSDEYRVLIVGGANR